MKWRGLTAWGVVLLTIGLLAGGAWLALTNLSRPTATVTIGASAIKADVARTDAQLERGLGGVTYLPPGSGMLFVFRSDGSHPMWMKDMKIDLDMVWLDEGKRVVHVERNVRASSYPATYQSQKPSRYVLELPAGSTTGAGISTGTTASFSLT